MAVLGLLTVAACKCSGDPDKETGIARVLATCVGDCGTVTRVTLTVAPGDGPDFQEMVTDLSRSGTQWTGRISGIPVGPGRRFTAVARNAQGIVTASGVAKEPIVKDEVTVVSIEMRPPSGPNHPPVIDGTSASSNPVLPGGTSTVAVAAHDPDPGDVLDYQWTATCGTISSPRATPTLWTAPQAEGQCSLTVTVSDGRGGTAVAVITLTVSSTGSVGVDTGFNGSPVITRLSAELRLGSIMTGDLTVTAVDPDGDPVRYEWSSDCPGLTFLLDPPHSPTQPAISFPGPSESCPIKVVVTDPPDRGGRTAGVLFLPPNQPLADCTGVVCKASDLCHIPGECDGYSGTCTPETAKCSAGQTCDPANGTCSGPSCSVVGCPPADLCHEPGICDTTTGQCSPGPPKSCPPGQTCDPANGTCSGPSCPVVGCPPADLCHEPGICDTTTGQCSPGPPKSCPSGQTCDLTDGQCKPGSSTEPIVRPQRAKLLEIVSVDGLGIDPAGATYLAGRIVPPPKTFDGHTVSSAGLNDLFAAKYDATGALLWATAYGDVDDQLASSMAVTGGASSRMVVSGRFTGAIGPLNSGSSTWDFLVFLDGATGGLSAARAIDTGVSGAIFAVGTNPGLGLVAVCGGASQLALDTTSGASGPAWATVPGANTYGGSIDIVLGLYDASGALRWAKQIGTTAAEQCSAVTIDDAGDVHAAGAYTGSGNLTLAGSTPLPNPGSSFRRHLWVAKFNGTTGAGITQAAFGGGPGSHSVNGIAVDASGNVYLAGAFTNSLPFTSTSGGGTACTAGSNGCLASAGAQDGFVARLSPALAPVWMTRIGAASDDLVRSVALDSQGGLVAGGLLSGASTASTITPTTTPTAAAGGPGLTAPAGSPASFVLRVPVSTGLLDPLNARTTGNGFDSATTRVAVNATGTGAVRDLVSFGGNVSGGTLDFGPPTGPLITTGAASFLVFAKLLP